MSDTSSPPPPSAPGQVPEKLLAMGLAGLGLAHELNSPLTSTALGLELLSMRLRGPRPPSPEDAAAAVDRLLTAVRRMGELIDRFRRFAKGEGGRPTRFAVDVALDEVQVLIRPTLSELTEVQLVRGPTADGVDVVIDRVLLEQAIAIAVLNSADALGSAGGRITIGAHRVADRVRIDIDDDGPGFSSPEDSSELGYSTKGDAGMGVGLALAIGIIESGGGRVELGNRPEGGARVRLELPAAAD